LPLSVRARVEIYLPDQPVPIYQDLLQTVVNEFTTSFGGCTLKRGIDGYYLSTFGEVIADRIIIVYSDTEFDFQENIDALAKYTENLRKYAFDALDEEEILIAVWPVHHSVEHLNEVSS
jgi:hypothetical protein